MKDIEFLVWIHERLVHVHGEQPFFDYMHKLRGIIAATPPERRTPHVDDTNNMQELIENLEKRFETGVIGLGLKERDYR
jgi:hypothetical protein